MKRGGTHKRVPFLLVGYVCWVVEVYVFWG